MSDTSKPVILQVAPKQVVEFWKTFVNRKAYVQQSDLPGGKSGKHYYFRPEVKATKAAIPLRPDTMVAHMAGWLTVGLYAINPETQASKWVAIDADYATALEDLKKLRDAFADDGIEALSEASRRGGHLWVFLEEPSPAAQLRQYVLNKAMMLGVAVKRNGDEDGIEVFPRQDSVGKGEFGNAIRAPLGIHRATNQRYWFEGAEQTIEAQLALVRSATRLSKAHLEQLTAGLQPVEPSRPKFLQMPAFHQGNSNIVAVPIGRHRRSGKNYVAECPACASRGEDRNRHHLSVLVSDPSVYHCFCNCSSGEIKRSLGVDFRARLQFAA